MTSKYTRKLTCCRTTNVRQGSGSVPAPQGHRPHEQGAGTYFESHQSVFHDPSVSSSSSDESSSDLGTDSDADSLREDAGDGDSLQGPHFHARDDQQPKLNKKYRFKVLDEKFGGSANKVELWLFNLEEYFIEAQIKKVMWIDIATSRMVDDATLWWRMLRKSDKEPVKWKHFKTAIRDRFLPLNAHRANRARLEECKQVASVTKYNSAFQAAYVECNDVSEAEARSRYISGLRSQTQRYVELENPKTLREAMKIAENFDHTSFRPHHEHHVSRSNQGSRPFKFKSKSRFHKGQSTRQRDDPMDLDQVEKHSIKLSWEEAKKFGLCVACGEKGHIKRNCPRLPQKAKN